MNSIHVLGATAVATAAAELDMSLPPILGLLVDDDGTSSHHRQHTNTQAVNVVLLVVVPIAFLVALYIVFEILYSSTWLRASISMGTWSTSWCGIEDSEDKEEVTVSLLAGGQLRVRCGQGDRFSDLRNKLQLQRSPQHGTIYQILKASIAMQDQDVVLRHGKVFTAVEQAVVLSEADGHRKSTSGTRDRKEAQALLVNAPEGVILQLDEALVPHPQETSVSFRSLKSTRLVIRGRVDELRGQSKVFVEFEFDGKDPILLSVLETVTAIHQVGHAPPADRKVLLHRAVDTKACRPFAVVKPTSSRRFAVLDVQCQDSLLTVHTSTDGHIERMEDSKGQIALRSAENVSNGFWVTYGADMALIASIILAVQKLS